MAAHDPASAQPSTTKHTVPTDGFQSVLRAARGEAAVRRQRRGDEALVAPNHAHGRPSRPSCNGLHRFTPPPSAKSATRLKAPRMRLHTLPAEPESPRPRRANPASTPAARPRGAGAVNDCGPPRWTEISERSVPPSGGPPDCRSITHRGAPTAAACRSKSSRNWKRPTGKASIRCCSAWISSRSTARTHPRPIICCRRGG